MATRRVVVELDEWTDGRLLNEDGQYCVLGKYLKDLGVPEGVLRGILGLSQLPPDMLPAEATWLKQEDYDFPKLFRIIDLHTPDRIGYIIEHINDANNLSKEEKIRWLSEIFAEHGVELKFVSNDNP